MLSFLQKEETRKYVPWCAKLKKKFKQAKGKNGYLKEWVDGGMEIG